MHRKIEVTNDESALSIEVDSVKKCLDILEASGCYEVPQGSLGIAFVNRDTCCRLHAQFFDDPHLTDVMTFPGDAEDLHAADIAICPSVAAEQCMEEHTSFNEELTLYLIHAWLHLAGLNDKDPASIKEMRTAESTLMRRLKTESSLLKAEWTA